MFDSHPHFTLLQCNVCAFCVYFLFITLYEKILNVSFLFQLPYTITIEYDTEQEILSTPSLSIPAKGFVPQTVETFVVHLPCTGKASDQVPLIINMFVKGPPRSNDTRLGFKREKNCTKGLYISFFFYFFSLRMRVTKGVC